MPSTQSVIDFLLVPQLGELDAVLDVNGPYYGGTSWTFTTFNDGSVIWSVSASGGVAVQFNGAIPAHLGLKVGYDDGASIQTDQFDFRLVQLVVMHQLHSGQWVVSQLEDIYTLPFVVRWTEALPGKIGLYVLPGVSVDLYYLQTQI